MYVQCSSCDFEAVPRVLKEHELLHFLPDELKLTSPEDIKKWREERKKYVQVVYGIMVMYYLERHLC